MHNEKFKPSKATKRMKFLPSFVIIGPSGAGKTTLVFAFLNHELVGFVKKGIGDKSQTTIISSNIVFDDRISKYEWFSIMVKRKRFESKIINNEILLNLANLFYEHRECTEDVIEAIDNKWLDNILEPKCALYHLEYLKQKLSIEELKTALRPILNMIENDKDFNNRVTERKKLTNSKKKDVYIDIFIETWSTITENDESILGTYDKWIQKIGQLIEEELNSLGLVNDTEIVDYSSKQDDELPYGGNVLSRLFDAKEPFSLLVDEITLTSKPSQELIDTFNRKQIPLRFCLRDTMGLTQSAIDYNTMKDALEIALNCNPDNILLMINLEDREDIITPCCEAINKKISLINERKIKLNIFFSKADQTVESFIDKISRNNKSLSQADYNKNIIDAITNITTKVSRYIQHMPSVNYTWGSLRFKEQTIDPVQTALVNNPELQDHFNPNGLYRYIRTMINVAQKDLLPKDYHNLNVINVENPDEDPIKIIFDREVAEDTLREIQVYLGTEKRVTNGYLIKENDVIFWKSVQTYYSRLQQGLGHTTRAKVYSNFSINMKGLILNTLLKFYPNTNSLCKMIQLIPDNVQETSKELVFKMKDNGTITSIIENRYLSILDATAYRLSYTNKEVRQLIDDIYYAPITYDMTMKKMQKKYQEFFLSDKFKNILVKELEEEMTLVVNKSFLAL